MAHHQVVIVGAGPVGLSLALSLAREGINTLVLEKNSSTSEFSRAPAIWPRTQEILADLGVIDSFLAEGLTKDELKILDVDHNTYLFKAPLAELADQTQYPHLLILPQSRTEQLLLQALRAQSSVELEFSSEVFDIIQDEGRVELQYHCGSVDRVVSADFVVGCDGAHSKVRNSIGARLEGITYPYRAALADIKLIGATGFHSPRLTSRPRLCIGVQITDERWRLILPFTEREKVSLENRVEAAVAHLFGESAWTTVWQSEFSLHRRLSTSFSKGRIVLAGDAAHLNSPAGGQGMNAGIQDAELLAQAVVASVSSGAIEPLEACARERRESVRTGVNRFTGILTRLLLSRDGQAMRSMLRLVNQAARFRPIRRSVLRRLAMLD